MTDDQIHCECICNCPAVWTSLQANVSKTTKCDVQMKKNLSTQDIKSIPDVFFSVLLLPHLYKAYHNTLD